MILNNDDFNNMYLVSFIVGVDALLALLLSAAAAACVSGGPARSSDRETDLLSRSCDR